MMMGMVMTTRILLRGWWRSTMTTGFSRIKRRIVMRSVLLLLLLLMMMMI